MTRKRAKKLLMALGFTRDSAEAALVRNKVSHDQQLIAAKRLIHTLRIWPPYELMPEGMIAKICLGGKDRTIILRK